MSPEAGVGPGGDVSSDGAMTSAGAHTARVAAPPVIRTEGLVHVYGGGTRALDGPTADVFDDSRLAAIGVEPPARARLGRLLAQHRIDAAVLAGAVADSAR